MPSRTLILAVIFLISATSAAFAQSGYTTGTIADRERGGYAPSGEYGGGGSLYAYTSGYWGGHIENGRRHIRHR